MKKIYSPSIVILLCLTLTLSCKKEDAFFNLTSEISGETTALEMDEGGSVIANIILSEELSEDLPIRLSVDTADIPNFINDDDYDSNFEYSNDLGNTWTTASNQTVIFEERNRNLKIRISSLDDNAIEFHEAFDLVFEPQTASDFNLTGSVDPIRISVRDNEEDNSYPGLMGALYNVDENTISP